MTLPSSDCCAQLLRSIAEPALRALALASLVGLVLALGRVRDAAVRLTVWTALLYAALAMPFLAGAVPAVRLPMPALVAAPSVPARAPAGIRIIATDTPAMVVATPTRPTQARLEEPSLRRPILSWPLFALALYVLIAGVLLSQLGVSFFFSRRVRLSGRPVGDQRLRAALLEQSTRWGLKTAPGLAESSAVTIPVTLGVWRPVILLPAAWRAWSEEKMQAVLAHELSHVARRDALTRALAAFHRSIFWFSPLAWWLERHLAALAEQASDDAALRTGADRILYARVLLGFYQDLQSAAGRVRWEGAAMTTRKQACERVDRILDSNRRLSTGLRKPVWAALALLAMPVIYLLASVQPVAARKPLADEAPGLASPLMTPSAGAVLAGMQAPPAAPPTPTAPAAPARAPVPPAAPKAPTPPPSTASEWRYGDSGEPWVLTTGESLSMSGSMQASEVERLRSLRRQSKADFIWFRRSGKAYIIRDAATVHQAKELFAPQQALSKQQEELGRQQEALGAQQEELGRQMEQIRVEVPDLTAELQKIQAQLDELHKHGGTQEELGAIQSYLGEIQGMLGEIQGKAGEQQGALGAKQGKLGELQGKLGEQQGKLGKEQARLAEEASRKMKALLDNALAKGLAQPE